MSKSKVKKPDSEPRAKKTIPAASPANSNPEQDALPAGDTNGHSAPVAPEVRENGAITVTPPLLSVSNGHRNPVPARTSAGVDLAEKVRDLVRLAQEQGYL